MKWLSRVLSAIRRAPQPDVLQPVSPRVSPDPDAAAALQRRREALTYYPENSFHSDTFVARRSR